jgi:chromosome segregation ATPase
VSDLQHQVSLKSLALQTLQAEYASLLQKLQRERVKSQAIEKKSTVADQEINELAGKNEELSDQIKELTTQLEECEKKRELERSEAQREKDQWGRMLEMSGRLQAKVEAERLCLLEEKEFLTRQIHGRKNLDQQRQTSIRPTSALGMSAILNDQEAEGNDALKGQISTLNNKIKALRSALEAVKRINLEMEEQTRGLLHRNVSVASTVDSALRDCDGMDADVSPSQKHSDTTFCQDGHGGQPTKPHSNEIPESIGNSSALLCSTGPSEAIFPSLTKKPSTTTPHLRHTQPSKTLRRIDPPPPLPIY